VVNAISNTGHFISTNLLQTELLLGHQSIANTSSYLGVESEAALELAQMIKLR
jgi:hypothetical protein